MPLIAGAGHLASVVTWRPLAATTVATTTWIVLSVRPSGLLLSTTAAAVAAAVPHLLDDPASATLQSSPTTLRRRQSHRLLTALPAVGLWWALATTFVSRSSAHLPLAAHTLQLIALLAIGLAGCAAAARLLGDDARCGIAGALAVMIGFGTGLLPEPALQLVPSDPAAPHAARQLVVVLALGLALHLAASTDRARRPAVGRRRSVQ